jgi:hypothetical protein
MVAHSEGTVLGARAFPGMFRRQQSNLISESWPIVAYLIGIGGFLFAFGGFIHWLLQPVVLPNPGLAAYQPPPATRLEPLIRKINVHELSVVADAVETDPVEPAGTIAAAPEIRRVVRGTKPSKPQREARSKNHKGAQLLTRRSQSPANAYAQDWNSWARRPGGGGFGFW